MSSAEAYSHLNHSVLSGFFCDHKECCNLRENSLQDILSQTFADHMIPNWILSCSWCTGCEAVTYLSWQNICSYVGLSVCICVFLKGWGHSRSQGCNVRQKFGAIITDFAKWYDHTLHMLRVKPLSKTLCALHVQRHLLYAPHVFWDLVFSSKTKIKKTFRCCCFIIPTSFFIPQFVMSSIWP